MIATNSEAVDRKDGSTRFVDAAVAGGIHQLMASIDEKLDVSRKALALVEANAQASKLLCEHLPANLPLAPKSISMRDTVYRADAELLFEIHDAQQACELSECLLPVPVTLVSAGCTTFVPTARYRHEAQTGDKVKAIGGVQFRTGHGCDTVSWWTEVNGLLVHVVAKTPENAPRKTGAMLLSRRMRDAHTEEGTWTYQGLPAGTIIAWYTSRGYPELSVYQSPDVSFRQALARPQEYVASGVLRRCEC